MSSDEDRRLSATLVHIDRLMEEALTVLANEDRSSLTRYRRDLSPERRASLEADVRHLRELLARVLIEAGIPVPEPVCGSLRAVHTQVLLAAIALEELGSLPTPAIPVERELNRLLETLREGCQRKT